jgi:hypothetical protein
MDEAIPKRETKRVLVKWEFFIVQMSHLNNLFLLSNFYNFYMDISGKVLYIKC